MLKKINIKWLLLISVLTAGAPIWFISYHSFTTKRIILISGILTLLLALLSSLSTKDQNKKIFYTIVAGFIVATIIKIIIDTISDPSSHNLLPFEIIYYTIIAFLSAGLGVGVSLLIKRFWY
jgi:hypothetical protein